MTWPNRRRWWLVALLGLLAVDPGTSSGQQKPPPYVPPFSLDDPRVEVYRQINKVWDARSGPRREVIDQVCLVPDLPTFFEAIATWDQAHYFPILIDDVETTFRFIRAFKPARIVRMPKSAPPIAAGQTWLKAVEAVGASWTLEGEPNAYRPHGDEVPKGLGPTPPGVVFSSPDAPMLAGAVALAAGRFEPLILVDYPKKFADVIPLEEVNVFPSILKNKVQELVAIADRIGDDCDFLTVAGDWPYSWRDEKGVLNAVDDRLGRKENLEHRWAYAGRLLGDAKLSVYRAMCSLFLQPESAVLFNGYEEASQPWSDYSMRLAAPALSTVMKTSHVSGYKEATIPGWHETFDPMNRFGLVMINSQGSPTSFAIQGGPGCPSDIPLSIPTIVLMIHSYSAERPNDPDTIAGRWLANGAYIYFGSMNEPYLQSFRNPRLVVDAMAENLPLVVALRMSNNEPFHQPWKLVYLGDPLYRLKTPTEARMPRLASWKPTASWPSYTEAARPADGAETSGFFWALKTALARCQGNPSKGTSGDDLVETLLAINRAKLPADFQPSFDALLIDVLLQARKRGSLRTRLAQIPEAERSSEVRRTLDSLLTIDLSLAIDRKDFHAARTVWRSLMKPGFPDELKHQATERLGKLADSPILREDWVNQLRTFLRYQPKSPITDVMNQELKRVEAELKRNR